LRKKAGRDEGMERAGVKKMTYGYKNFFSKTPVRGPTPRGKN